MEDIIIITLGIIKIGYIIFLILLSADVRVDEDHIFFVKTTM